MTLETLRLELFVDDVERSVAFYRDVLGFEAPDRASQSTYCPLHFGAVRVAVQDIRTLEAGHPLAQAGRRGLGVELVLEVPEVPDVQASYAKAAASSAAVSPLVQQPWGLSDFRVSDPDGYYWRVTSRRAKG